MTNDGKRKLTHKDYTVAWVVVLQVELTPARKLLDKEDEPLPRSKKDDNNYVLGQSGEHNIVITRPSVYGTNATAHAVANMLRTFPNVRFGLLVGIGGGAPKPPRKDPNKDIRLGDVVVSFPKGGHGGVLQYDMGRWEGECDFQIQSHLNRPPGILLSAITGLGSEHDLDNGRMNEYIRNGWWKSVTFPGRDEDRLFRSDYRHIPGEDCEACDRTMTITRVERQSNEPVVHQGLIASGNALEKSPQHRDKLRDRWDVACFEMEAAGLMNDFPCLVIRGISDYSDSHKNDEWQPYAALTAAAYAKDLLRVIKGEQVIAEPPATERLNRPKQDSDSSLSTQDLAPLDNRLNALEERVQALGSKLEGMVGKHNNSGQVIELERRLEALSTRLDMISSEANSTQPKIKQLNDRVLELERGIAKPTGRLPGGTMHPMDHSRVGVSEYGLVGRVEAGRASVTRQRGGGPTRIRFQQRFDHVPHVQITPERGRKYENFLLYLYNDGRPCVDCEGFDVGCFLHVGHTVTFRWLAVEIV